MFKHLLLPTDGSPLSEKAVLKGIRFARAVGARLTGVYVSPRFHVLTYRTDMLEETRVEYARDSQAHAERYLAFISKAAAESGVPCETALLTSDDVFQSIIDLARERVRPHRDGFARASRHQWRVARQRDTTRAAPFGHSRARVALKSRSTVTRRQQRMDLSCPVIKESRHGTCNPNDFGTDAG